MEHDRGLMSRSATHRPDKEVDLKQRSQARNLHEVRKPREGDLH